MSQIEDFLSDKPSSQPKSGGDIDSFLSDAPKSYGLKDFGGDLASVVAKGVMAVPQAAVGLADIATGGRAGKALEDAGVRFKEANQIADSWKSDALKAQQKEFQDAEGIGGKAVAALSNPGLIASTVAESIPSMFLGGALAKGAGMAIPALAGRAGLAAAGEGAVMAGSQAENIRQQTADGLLTPGQSALAAATGVAGGAIGALGARAGKALGVGDIDSMIANGATQGVAREGMGLASRVGRGALSEGVLEELPQSLSETAFENVALDKPVTEGMDEAAVLGTLSGGLMGGIAGGLSSPAKPSQQMGIDPNAGPLSRAAAASVDSQPVPQPLGASITGTAPADLMGRATDPLAEQITTGRKQAEAGSVAQASPAAASEPVPLEQRSLDELRQAFRSAQDPAIRKTLAAEIRKRREAMPDPLAPVQPQQEIALEPQASQAVQSQPQEAQAQAEPAVLGQPLTDTGTNMLGRGADPLQSIIQGQADARRAADELRGTTGASTVTGGDITPPSVESPVADVRSGGRNDDAGTAQPDANGDAGGAVGSTAQGSAALRPDNWRGNAIKAGKVARSLGLDPKGKRLKEIVAEIDAVDAGSGIAAKPVSREQAIRDAWRNEPRTIGKWTPISVEAEGQKADMLVNQKRAGGDKDGALHVVNIRMGKMLKDMDREPIAYTFRLTADNLLVEEGIPTVATPGQIAAWKGAGFALDDKQANVQNTPQGTAGESKAPSVKESKAEGGNAASNAGVPAARDTAAMENNGVKSREVMPAELTLEVGGRFYPVESLAQASEMVSQAKQKFTEAKASGKAGGFVEDAPIRDGDGRIVGYVGRGGSVFDVPNAGPRAKKLYDAGADLAKAVGESEAVTRPALPKPAAPGAGDVQADGVKEAWGLTREQYFNDPARVRREAVGPAAVGWKASYEYTNPSGSGPFKGSTVLKVKPKAGDTINAPFGRARVTSVSAVKGASIDNAELLDIGKAHHRRVVADAIASGKPVPDDVLAEYPDLSKNPRELNTSAEPVQKTSKNEQVAQADGVEEEAKKRFSLEAGKPAYLDRAQKLVRDNLDGKINQEETISGFLDLGMTVGQVRSVATPLDWWTVNVQNEYEQRASQPKQEAKKDAAPSAQAEKPAEQVNPEPSKAVQPKAERPAEKIEDLGEKIGGARKDTATSTGKTGKKKTDDERPAWMRRYQVTQVADVQGVPDAGRWVIRDKKNLDFMNQPKMATRETFDSQEAAEAMLPVIAVGRNHRAVPMRDGKYEIWRDINDRKRVKIVDKTFDTRTEALEYMLANAVEIIEANTTFGEADLPKPPNTQRIGKDRRTGNVNGEDFRKVFGFRGVEFGNWNNQEERQEVMNEAYDGLLDLAEVMGIPPKAISMGGELALAFGARGNGLSGARAHYEPAKAVINLTKMNGAGALAHEWFHAMDHFFGRQDGKASKIWEIGKDGTRTLKASAAFENDAVTSGFGYKSGVREEVRAAYKALMETIYKKAQAYVEDTAKADKFVATIRGEVQSQLDSIRRDLAEQKDPRYYKTKNKPASAEQLAAFDTLAQQIMDGTAVETKYMAVPGSKSLTGGRWSNDALEAISAIYKTVRGRSGFDSTNQKGFMDRLRGTMSNYAQRLKMLADAQSGEEKTKKVPTDFAMDAKSLDQGRGTDYWTTAHEMGARAFQGYVEDKIAEMGGKSPFLNYGPENAGILTPWGWSRPYPAGQERIAINKAMDNLVKTIRTRETEDGNTEMYYGTNDAKRQGSPVDRAIMYMAGEGREANEILSFIAKSSKSPYRRQLAQKLLATGANPAVSLGGEMGGGAGFRFLAKYSRKNHEVTLSEAAADRAEQIFLHETVHAATLLALDKGGLIATQMNRLYESVKAQGGAEGQYGLKNVGEFVAEAFTNPDFQKALKGMKADKGSLWDRLVNIVRRILGMEPRQQDALSKALELGAGVMRENMPLRAAKSFRAEDGPAFAGEDEANFGIADASPNNAREAVQPVVQLLNDTFKVRGKIHWWHKTVGTPFNLAERVPEFKRVFNSVQDFINSVSFYGAEAAAMAPKIIPKLESWKDLGKSPIKAEDNKAIAAPIFEGTLSWRRGKNGTPVRTDDVGDAGIVWKDDELRSMFKLNDEQIGLYREFRAATDKSLTDLALSDILQFAGKDAEPIKDTVMGMSLKEGSETVSRYLKSLAEGEDKVRKAMLFDTANSIKEKADKAQSLMDRGYAPLQRFGRHTLYATNDKGEQLFFGMYEDRWAAARAARQMREQYPSAKVEVGMMSEQSYKLFQGISPETLELFGTMLGLDPQADGKTNEAFQTYLKLAKSNRSALKRLIERKGISGYSEDASRVLASFIYSNARQTASNLHVGEIMNGVNDIPRDMGEAKDAAVRLARYTMDPQEEAQALRGLLFAQYLGGSIASAAINALQPAQVTFPYLSQFVGAKKSASLMTGAVRDALKKSTGDPRLDAELKKAEEEGIVSPQEIFQLMAQAQGKATLKAGDGTKAGDAMAAASNTLSRLSLGWGKVFSIPEQFNRRTTFIAAYRTAKETGEANPYEFAKQAVKETQLVYNKGNRPEWARGTIGALAFTFKTYSISYVELLQRMAASGPEGRRAALLMVGVLFVMAGAGGLPGVEDAEDVVDGIAQRVFGLNFQTRQKRQEWLADTFGEGGARFIENGLSGLPWSPTDVSGRLGLGNLIPGTGLFVKKENYGRDVAEIAGPAADMTKRFLEGAGLLLQGEVLKAGEIVSPTAVRNMIQGGRMMATDQYTDTKGRKVIDTTPAEGITKLIGFQPADVARVQEATGTMQRMIALNKIRESEIADKWAKGLASGDAEQVQDARDELRKWNESNPESPIRINMPQLFRRVRALKEDKATRIARTAPKEIRQDVRRALEQGQ